MKRYLQNPSECLECSAKSDHELSSPQALQRLLGAARGTRLGARHTARCAAHGPAAVDHERASSSTTSGLNLGRITPTREAGDLSVSFMAAIPQFRITKSNRHLEALSSPPLCVPFTRLDPTSHNEAGGGPKRSLSSSSDMARGVRVGGHIKHSGSSQLRFNQNHN
ncbi:hypothetical protein JYU34_005506 [Plutella xylostella]|uniref:Uncharacterized protein n=1 Tax=Plutella xylostella TaxID=51655 RepID=A0ABQ7QTF8_PLUXY|nr:hypothetical protein JYU34_005506 [Plutella xylostella]